uniref:GRIP domain-containing protein n=1 Tax=Strongyloides venezuelensis TaxID=75913 RepID=A0A0K0EXZ1_STRVS
MSSWFSSYLNSYSKNSCETSENKNNEKKISFQNDTPLSSSLPNDLSTSSWLTSEKFQTCVGDLDPEQQKHIKSVLEKAQKSAKDARIIITPELLRRSSFLLKNDNVEDGEVSGNEITTVDNETDFLEMEDIPDAISISLGTAYSSLSNSIDHLNTLSNEYVDLNEDIGINESISKGTSSRGIYFNASDDKMKNETIYKEIASVTSTIYNWIQNLNTEDCKETKTFKQRHEKIYNDPNFTNEINANINSGTNNSNIEENNSIMKLSKSSISQANSPNINFSSIDIFCTNIVNNICQEAFKEVQNNKLYFSTNNKKKERNCLELNSISTKNIDEFCTSLVNNILLSVMNVIVIDDKKNKNDNKVRTYSLANNIPFLSDESLMEKVEDLKISKKEVYEKNSTSYFEYKTNCNNEGIIDNVDKSFDTSREYLIYNSINRCNTSEDDIKIFKTPKSENILIKKSEKNERVNEQNINNLMENKKIELEKTPSSLSSQDSFEEKVFDISDIREELNIYLNKEDKDLPNLEDPSSSGSYESFFSKVSPYTIQLQKFDTIIEEKSEECSECYSQTCPEHNPFSLSRQNLSELYVIESPDLEKIELYKNKMNDEQTPMPYFDKCSPTFLNNDNKIPAYFAALSQFKNKQNLYSDSFDSKKYFYEKELSYDNYNGKLSATCDDDSTKYVNKTKESTEEDANTNINDEKGELEELSWKSSTNKTPISRGESFSISELKTLEKSEELSEGDYCDDSNYEICTNSSISDDDKDQTSAKESSDSLSDEKFIDLGERKVTNLFSGKKKPFSFTNGYFLKSFSQDTNNRSLSIKCLSFSEPYDLDIIADDETSDVQDNEKSNIYGDPKISRSLYEFNYSSINFSNTNQKKFYNKNSHSSGGRTSDNDCFGGINESDKQNINKANIPFNDKYYIKTNLKKDIFINQKQLLSTTNNIFINAQQKDINYHKNMIVNGETTNEDNNDILINYVLTNDKNIQQSITEMKEYLLNLSKKLETNININTFDDDYSSDVGEVSSEKDDSIYEINKIERRQIVKQLSNYFELLSDDLNKTIDNDEIKNKNIFEGVTTIYDNIYKKLDESVDGSKNEIKNEVKSICEAPLTVNMGIYKIDLINYHKNLEKVFDSLDKSIDQFNLDKVSRLSTLNEVSSEEETSDEVKSNIHIEKKMSPLTESSGSTSGADTESMTSDLYFDNESNIEDYEKDNDNGSEKETSFEEPSSEELTSKLSDDGDEPKKVKHYIVRAVTRKSSTTISGGEDVAASSFESFIDKTTPTEKDISHSEENIFNKEVQDYEVDNRGKKIQEDSYIISQPDFVNEFSLENQPSSSPTRTLETNVASFFPGSSIDNSFPSKDNLNNRSQLSFSLKSSQQSTLNFRSISDDTGSLYNNLMNEKDFQNIECDTKKEFKTSMTNNYTKYNITKNNDEKICNILKIFVKNVSEVENINSTDELTNTKNKSFSLHCLNMDEIGEKIPNEQSRLIKYNDISIIDRPKLTDIKHLTKLSRERAYDQAIVRYFTKCKQETPTDEISSPKYSSQQSLSSLMKFDNKKIDNSEKLSGYDAYESITKGQKRCSVDIQKDTNLVRLPKKEEKHLEFTKEYLKHIEYIKNMYEIPFGSKVIDDNGKEKHNKTFSQPSLSKESDNTSEMKFSINNKFVSYEPSFEKSCADSTLDDTNEFASPVCEFKIIDFLTTQHMVKENQWTDENISCIKLIDKCSQELKVQFVIPYFYCMKISEHINITRYSNEDFNRSIKNNYDKNLLKILSCDNLSYKSSSTSGADGPGTSFDSSSDQFYFVNDTKYVEKEFPIKKNVLETDEKYMEYQITEEKSVHIESINKRALEFNNKHFTEEPVIHRDQISLSRKKGLINLESESSSTSGAGENGASFDSSFDQSYLANISSYVQRDSTTEGFVLEIHEILVEDQLTKKDVSHIEYTNMKARESEKVDFACVIVTGNEQKALLERQQSGYYDDGSSSTSGADDPESSFDSSFDQSMAMDISNYVKKELPNEQSELETREFHYRKEFTNERAEESEIKDFVHEKVVPDDQKLLFKKKVAFYSENASSSTSGPDGSEFSFDYSFDQSHSINVLSYVRSESPFVKLGLEIPKKSDEYQLTEEELANAEYIKKIAEESEKKDFIADKTDNHNQSMMLEKEISIDSKDESPTISVVDDPRTSFESSFYKVYVKSIPNNVRKESAVIESVFEIQERSTEYQLSNEEVAHIENINKIPKEYKNHDLISKQIITNDNNILHDDDVSIYSSNSLSSISGADGHCVSFYSSFDQSNVVDIPIYLRTRSQIKESMIKKSIKTQSEKINRQSNIESIFDVEYSRNITQQSKNTVFSTKPTCYDDSAHESSGNQNLTQSSIEEYHLNKNKYPSIIEDYVDNYFVDFQMVYSANQLVENGISLVRNIKNTTNIYEEIECNITEIIRTNYQMHINEKNYSLTKNKFLDDQCKNTHKVFDLQKVSGQDIVSLSLKTSKTFDNISRKSSGTSGADSLIDSFNLYYDQPYSKSVSFYNEKNLPKKETSIEDKILDIKNKLAESQLKKEPAQIKCTRVIEEETNFENKLQDSFIVHEENIFKHFSYNSSETFGANEIKLIFKSSTDQPCPIKTSLQKKNNSPIIKNSHHEFVNDIEQEQKVYQSSEEELANIEYIRKMAEESEVANQVPSSFITQEQDISPEEDKSRHSSYNSSETSGADAFKSSFDSSFDQPYSSEIPTYIRDKTPIVEKTTEEIAHELKKAKHVRKMAEESEVANQVPSSFITQEQDISPEEDKSRHSSYNSSETSGADAFKSSFDSSFDQSNVIEVPPYFKENSPIEEKSVREIEDKQVEYQLTEEELAHIEYIKKIPAEHIIDVQIPILFAAEKQDIGDVCSSLYSSNDNSMQVDFLSFYNKDFFNEKLAIVKNCINSQEKGKQNEISITYLDEVYSDCKLSGEKSILLNQEKFNDKANILGVSINKYIDGLDNSAMNFSNNSSTSDYDQNINLYDYEKDSPILRSFSDDEQSNVYDFNEALQNVPSQPINVFYESEETKLGILDSQNKNTSIEPFFYIEKQLNDTITSCFIVGSEYRMIEEEITCSNYFYKEPENIFVEITIRGLSALNQQMELAKDSNSVINKFVNYQIMEEEIWYTDNFRKINGNCVVERILPQYASIYVEKEFSKIIEKDKQNIYQLSVEESAHIKYINEITEEVETREVLSSLGLKKLDTLPEEDISDQGSYAHPEISVADIKKSSHDNSTNISYPKPSQYNKKESCEFKKPKIDLQKEYVNYQLTKEELAHIEYVMKIAGQCEVANQVPSSFIAQEQDIPKKNEKFEHSSFNSSETSGADALKSSFDSSFDQSNVIEVPPYFKENSPIEEKSVREIEDKQVEYQLTEEELAHIEHVRKMAEESEVANQVPSSFMVYEKDILTEEDKFEHSSYKFSETSGADDIGFFFDSSFDYSRSFEISTRVKRESRVEEMTFKVEENNSQSELDEYQLTKEELEHIEYINKMAAEFDHNCQISDQFFAQRQETLSEEGASKLPCPNSSDTSGPDLSKSSFDSSFDQTQIMEIPISVNIVPHTSLIDTNDDQKSSLTKSKDSFNTETSVYNRCTNEIPYEESHNFKLSSQRSTPSRLISQDNPFNNDYSSTIYEEPDDLYGDYRNSQDNNNINQQYTTKRGSFDSQTKSRYCNYGIPHSYNKQPRLKKMNRRSMETKVSLNREYPRNKIFNDDNSNFFNVQKRSSSIDLACHRRSTANRGKRSKFNDNSIQLNNINGFERCEHRSYNTCTVDLTNINFLVRLNFYALKLSGEIAEKAGADLICYIKNQNNPRVRYFRNENTSYLQDDSIDSAETVEYNEEDRVLSDKEIKNVETSKTSGNESGIKSSPFSINVKSFFNSTKSYLSLNKKNQAPSTPMLRLPSFSRSISPESTYGINQQGTPSRKNSDIINFIRRTSYSSTTFEPPIQLPDDALEGLTEDEVNHISSVIKNANNSIVKSPRPSIQYDELNMEHLNKEEREHVKNVIRKASEIGKHFNSKNYDSINQPINNVFPLTDEELEHIQKIQKLAEMDEAMSASTMSAFNVNKWNSISYSKDNSQVTSNSNELSGEERKHSAVKVQMPNGLKSTSISYNNSLELTQEELEHIDKINQMAEQDAAMNTFYGRTSLDNNQPKEYDNELTEEELEHIRRVNEMAMRDIDNDSQFTNKASDTLGEGENNLYGIQESSLETCEETDSANEVLADDKLYDIERINKHLVGEYQLTEEEIKHIKRIQELAEQENTSSNENIQFVQKEVSINKGKEDLSLTEEELEHIRMIQRMADEDERKTLFKTADKPSPTKNINNELTEEEIKHIRNVQAKILKEEQRSLLTSKQIVPEVHQLTDEEIVHIRKIQEMAEMDELASYQQRLHDKTKEFDICYFENDRNSSKNILQSELINNYQKDDIFKTMYSTTSSKNIIIDNEKMSVDSDYNSYVNGNQMPSSNNYNISLPSDFIGPLKLQQYKSVDSSSTLESVSSSSYKKEYNFINERNDKSSSSKFTSTDTGNFSDYSDDSNHYNKKYSDMTKMSKILIPLNDITKTSKLKRSRSVDCLVLLESEEYSGLSSSLQTRYSLPLNLLPNNIKEYYENTQETKEIFAQIQKLNEPEYINKILDVEEEYQPRNIILNRRKKSICGFEDKDHLIEWFTDKNNKIIHLKMSHDDKKYMDYSSTSILSKENAKKDIFEIDSSKGDGYKKGDIKISTNSLLTPVNEDKFNGGKNSFIECKEIEKSTDAERQQSLYTYHLDFNSSNPLQQINYKNLSPIPGNTNNTSTFYRAAESGVNEQIRQTFSSYNQPSSISSDHTYHSKDITSKHNILPITPPSNNISLLDQHHQLTHKNNSRINSENSNIIKSGNVVVENSNISQTFYSPFISYSQLTNNSYIDNSSIGKKNSSFTTCEENQYTSNFDKLPLSSTYISNDKESSILSIGIPSISQHQVSNITNEVFESNLTNTKLSNDNIVGYSGSEKFGGVVSSEEKIIEESIFSKHKISMFKSSNSGFSRFGSLGRLANAAISSAQKAGEQLTAVANNAVAQATSMDNITSLGQSTHQQKQSPQTTSSTTSSRKRSQSAFDISQGMEQKEGSMSTNYISSAIPTNIPNPIELPPGLEDLSDEERRKILAVLMEAENINDTGFNTYSQQQQQPQQIIVEKKEDINKMVQEKMDINNEYINNDIKPPLPEVKNTYSVNLSNDNNKFIDNQMYSKSSPINVKETNNDITKSIPKIEDGEYLQSQLTNMSNKEKESFSQVDNNIIINENGKNINISSHANPLNERNELNFKDEYHSVKDKNIVNDMMYKDRVNIILSNDDNIKNNSISDNCYVDNVSQYQSTTFQQHNLSQQTPPIYDCISSSYTYDNDIPSNVSPQNEFCEDSSIKQFENIEKDVYNSISPIKRNSVNLILSSNEKNSDICKVDGVELSGEIPYSSYDDSDDLDNIKLENVYTMKKPRMWTTVFTDETDSEDGLNENNSNDGMSNSINLIRKNDDWLMEDSSCQPTASDSKNRMTSLTMMGNSDEGYEIEMDDPLSQEMIITNSHNVTSSNYGQNHLDSNKMHIAKETPPVILVTSVKDDQHTHRYEDSSEGETSPSSDEDDYPDHVIEVPTIAPSSMNYEDVTESEKKTALEKELIQQIQSFGEVANDEFDVQWKSENEISNTKANDTLKDQKLQDGIINKSQTINRTNPFIDNSKFNDFTANDASTAYDDDISTNDVVPTIIVKSSKGKTSNKEENKNKSVPLPVPILRPGPVYTIPENTDEDSSTNTEGKYIAHKIERKPLRVSLNELDKFQIKKNNNQVNKKAYIEDGGILAQKEDYVSNDNMIDNGKIYSNGISKQENINSKQSPIQSSRKSPSLSTESCITEYAEQTNRRLKELEERLENKTIKDIETVKKQLDQLLQQGNMVKYDKGVINDITDGASVYDSRGLKYKRNDEKCYDNEYSQEGHQNLDYPNLFPKLLNNVTEKDIIEASILNDIDNSFVKLKRSPAMILTSEDQISSRTSQSIEKPQGPKSDDETISQHIASSEIGRRKLPSLPIQHQGLSQQRYPIPSLYYSSSNSNIPSTPSSIDIPKDFTLTFEDLAKFSLHPSGQTYQQLDNNKWKTLPGTFKLSNILNDSVAKISQDNYAISTKVGLNNASKLLFTKEPIIHPGASFKKSTPTQQQMFMMPSTLQAKKLSQPDILYDNSNKLSGTLPLKLSAEKIPIQHSMLTQPIEKQHKMCDIMARVAFKKELKEKLAKRLLSNDKTEIEANQRNYKINKMYTTGIVTEIRPSELNLIPDTIKSDLPEEITRNARVTKCKDFIDNIDTFGSLKSSFDEFDQKMKKLYNYSVSISSTLPSYHQSTNNDLSKSILSSTKLHQHSNTTPTTNNNIISSSKSVACQCDHPSSTPLVIKTTTDTLTLPVYQKNINKTSDIKKHRDYIKENESYLINKTFNKNQSSEIYGTKNSNAECQTDVSWLLLQNKQNTKDHQHFRSIPNIPQCDDDFNNIYDSKTELLRFSRNEINYDNMRKYYNPNLPLTSTVQLNSRESDYYSPRGYINRFGNLNSQKMYSSLGTLNIGGSSGEEDLEFKRIDALNEIAKRKEKLNTLRRIKDTISGGSNYDINRSLQHLSLNRYHEQLYKTDYSSTVPHYSSMPMLSDDARFYGINSDTNSLLRDAIKNPYSTLGRCYRDHHLSKDNNIYKYNYHSSLPRSYGLHTSYDNQRTNILGYQESSSSTNQFRNNRDYINRPYLSKSVYDLNTTYQMREENDYGCLYDRQSYDNRRDMLNKNLSRSYGGLLDPYITPYNSNIYRHHNHLNNTLHHKKEEMESEMLSEYANYLNKHYMSGGNNVDNYLMDDSISLNQGQIPETDLVYDNQNIVLPYYDNNMSSIKTNIPMDTFQNYYQSSTLPSQVYSRKETNYGARPFNRVGEYGNGFRNNNNLHDQQQNNESFNIGRSNSYQSNDYHYNFNKSLPHNNEASLTDEINSRLKEDPLSKIYATIGQKTYNRNLLNNFNNQQSINRNDYSNNYSQKLLFKQSPYLETSNSYNSYGNNYDTKNQYSSYNSTPRKTLSFFNISMPEDLPIKKRFRDIPIKRILLTRKYKNSNFFNDTGIRITGGKKLDDGNLGAFITAINKNHCYETLGQIQEGDRVLAINDINLSNKSYEEVERILNNTKGEFEIIIQQGCKKNDLSEDGIHFSGNEKMYDDVPGDINGIFRKPLKSTLKKSSTRSNNRQVYYEDSTPDSGFDGKIKEAPPIPAHRHEVHNPHYDMNNCNYGRKNDYNFSPQRLTKSLNNSNGYLQVALAYDLPQNLLFVTVIAARNLKVKSTYDSIVLPNPFVKIYLLPNRKVSRKRRTKYIPNTSDPVWNQTVEYHVPYERLSTQWLEFTVWDYDKYSDSLSLGQVIIALSDSQIFDNQPRWYPLHSSREESSLLISNNILLPSPYNQSFSKNLNKPSFIKGNTYHYNPNYLDINYPAIC